MTTTNDVGSQRDGTASVATADQEAPDHRPSATPAPPPVLIGTVDLPDAIAVNVADSPRGDAVASWTTADGVYIGRLTTQPVGMGEPLGVSGDLVPVAHAIERPALSVGPDDVVHVAFTAPADAGSMMHAGSVHYVTVIDDRPSAPTRISGEPRPETNLVHMSPIDDVPVLAWLEDSSLSLALHDHGGPAEIEGVDELTCDCCNPVPIGTGDRIVVAYRDQLRTDDGVIRDVVVTTSDDGTTWSDARLVADDHWFLDGCPFSGPSVATVGDTYLVVWMDGRQSVHPDQDGTTIWIDRSLDGGETFGHDLALTEDGIHRWPSIAVGLDETVHVVWETQASDGGITYSSSSDLGLEFTTPHLLLPNTTDSGPRRTPSVVVRGDHLIVSWIDRSGGHVAVFTLGSTPG